MISCFNCLWLIITLKNCVLWWHLQTVQIYSFFFHFFFFKDLVEKKGSWSKPINSLTIKKLFTSIIKEIQQPTTDFSFAPELFNGVNLNNIILEINSLSREVLLNKMTMTTADTSNTECGKVFVTEAIVTCRMNQLTVNQKVYTLCM